MCTQKNGILFEQMKTVRLFKQKHSGTIAVAADLEEFKHMSTVFVKSTEIPVKPQKNSENIT